MYRDSSNHSNRSHQRRDRAALGFFILLVGVLLLVRRLDLFWFDIKLWPLVLIGVGIYTGSQNRFQNFTSWLLIGLGVAFLLPWSWIRDFFSTLYVAPVSLILLGLYLMFRRGHPKQETVPPLVEKDTLDLNVQFQEKQTMVTSKNFKGGRIHCSFGEAEVNLLQVEPEHHTTLDVSVSFGSLTILVPRHWEVELRVSNSFSSVEDKRMLSTGTLLERKLLVIEGSCHFGSINVKSV